MNLEKYTIYGDGHCFFSSFLQGVKKIINPSYVIDKNFSFSNDENKEEIQELRNAITEQVINYHNTVVGINTIFYNGEEITQESYRNRMRNSEYASEMEISQILNLEDYTRYQIKIYCCNENENNYYLINTYTGTNFSDDNNTVHILSNISGTNGEPNKCSQTPCKSNLNNNNHFELLIPNSTGYNVISNKYYSKYIKYKNKYLKLKKQNNL
jgi:hypothetical protein